METLEITKRRRRDVRRSDGVINEATERDLIWFRFLAEHAGTDEGLPTSFLHAFTADRWTCEFKAKDRLKWLFHRDSIHGGPYLDRDDDHSTVEHCYEAIHKLTP